MPELKFTKPADSKEEIKLESALIYADWRQGAAYTGYKAAFEVVTVFVGNGAKIEIAGKSEKGKKLGKIKDTIDSNRYIGSFDIPSDAEPGDQVWFEVKISANGIDGESGRIPVYPAPVVTNMAWSANEARRGDTLRLTADVDKVEGGTEATVTILEYDNDGAHDKIVELPAVIKDKKLEIDWEYEYHEDVDELPTSAEVERYGATYNPPEYFYTITIGGVVFGRNQESGIIKFKDWVEFVFADREGNPVAEEKFTAVLPDGKEIEVQTNSEGVIRLNDILPGRVVLKSAEEKQEDEKDQEEDKEKEEKEPGDAKEFQASDDLAEKEKKAVDGEIEDEDDNLDEKYAGAESVESEQDEVIDWVIGIPAKKIADGIYEIHITGYGLADVGPYKELLKHVGVGSGLECHHIVEVEHLDMIHTGFTKDNAPAVAIPADMHRELLSPRFTAEQGFLGGRYGGKAIVTKGELLELYEQIYTEHTPFKELFCIATHVLG